MKTLYLLRHAKSSWDDRQLSDFDRPLNERGLKAAPRIGALLRKRKIKPGLILSSPALRAKQTAELVCEAAGLTALLSFEPEIYEASANRLLKIVEGLSDEIDPAMLVGHNPGFAELLAGLTGQTREMPTAALACIELPIECWSDATLGSGKLAWLIRAKDLK